jgi:signal transduction histidine kinase
VTSKGQPFAPVNLTSLAEEAIADLEERIHQTGGKVEIGDLPTIDADGGQIRRLLQNLIGNALKFHRPETPPVVRIEGKVVGENGQNGDGASPRTPYCELAIRDNGIGFDEVFLDKIFEVFQRLHGRNEYEGTGMGLAICRKIAERHFGSITARSAPGEGSTFIVRLPVHQAQGRTTNEQVSQAYHYLDGR